MLITLSLLLGLAWSQEVKYYEDFSGGLNTWKNSVIIEDNESPDLQNVVLDDDGTIKKRDGNLKRNSTAIGGGSSDVNAFYALEQTDGDQYCVAFSSTSGYSSTDDCSSNTVFVSTLTRNNDVNCDAINDRLYCVNNQYNFYFDGTNDLPFSAVSDLEFIRVHRSRCFASGNDANPDRLYWSSLGDCDTWTTSTDFIDVSPEDGDRITGIGEPIFDMLPIYKKFSTWALRGNTPQTWQLINISKNTGAINHRSIKNFNNVQLFDSVGPNGGQFGIYGFNGIVINEFSKKLRNSIDTLQTSLANTGRKIIDTYADWSAGTFSSLALSVDRDPGFIQPKYFSSTETSATDFSSGTLVNLSSSVVTGRLVMVQENNGTFSNAGGETDTTFPHVNWFLNTANNTSDSTMYGSRAWYPTGTGVSLLNVTVKVLDGSDATLITDSFILTNGAEVTERTIDVSALTTNYIKLDFTNDCNPAPCSSNQSTTVGFLKPRNSLVYKYKDANATTSVSLAFDLPETTQTISATNTSPIFDTVISTPVWGHFQVTMSSSSVSAITFQVQSSTAGDGGGLESLVSQNNNSVVSAANRRYLRHVDTWSIGYTTDPPQNVSDISFSASSTGTWTSSELFLSNSMASWGAVQCERTITGSGAAIAYTIRTSTFSGGSLLGGAASQAITCGSSLSVATGAYVNIHSTYTVAHATEIAKTDALTFNWTEGSGAKSAASAIFKNRYHYVAQSSAATTNDTIYVLDSLGAWYRWAGINPRFINVVSQKLMTGDSLLSGSGFIYQLYNGDSDNGSAINSYWTSKDFALGPIHTIKAIDRIYTVHSNDNTTLTTTLGADTGLNTHSYSVSLSTGASFGVSQRVIEPSINGNTFRIRFGESGLSTPWSIIGFGLQVRPLGVMQ